MNFSIRGQHIEVTDALKDYVDKKLGRLEKYFDAPPTSEGYVTLSVIRGLHTVEVTIPLPGVMLRQKTAVKICIHQLIRSWTSWNVRFANTKLN
ncbi:ribosomal subunit interface protein [Paenibacillus pini JCM 16418]|uniref:Ribosomal subunit interface protein n=1 Tax=Paenibacillus pini JCM 16418 TaxID=1236976 RepID=W7YHA3_9BACL|nr:ribosomal subunit interface protein [Paenibacillus pini JCM 16418]